MTDRIYNDLGFLLGEKFVILIETQSLWTLNIIIRALLYLAQTYHNYFERTNQNLYKSKNVLKEYLQNREQEVVSIMMSLFDEEERVKNKFFTRQVCAARSANIGALAARERRLAA